MSLEVKMVKIAIIALKEKNNFFWLDFDFVKIIAAIYEKNPILSRTTEILVQDINITSILRGLILALLKNTSPKLIGSTFGSAR